MKVMKEIDGIRIRGVARFVDPTVDALKFIKDHDSDSYEKVQEAFDRIEHGRYTELDIEGRTYRASWGTAFPKVEKSRDSKTWYASTIVHNAEHCDMQNNEGILYNDENRDAHEERAIAAQRGFLERVKAPEYMLEHLEDMLDDRYWAKPEKYGRY